MRWRNRRQSTNIEDRRAMRGGGGVRLTGGMGGLGLVAFVVIALLLGVDPMALLQQTSGPPPATTRDQEDLRDFVAVVLADTEDVWTARFEEAGGTYVPVPVVLYTGRTSSGCGLAGAEIGPFYCPGDQRIYLDLSFFDDLERELGARGDFARAYVVAHEVGHYIQDQIGVLGQINRRMAGLPEDQANALSVRLELQADCLAGVWSHDAEAKLGVLEPGDIEEALGAAARIGDDALQQRARGYVVPDSFTHGTSAQRVAWFNRGYRSGDQKACDTFSAAAL